MTQPPMTRTERRCHYAERRILYWLQRRNVANSAGKTHIAAKCQRKAKNWLFRADALALETAL